MTISVSWAAADGPRRVRFTSPFCIGYDARGELQVDDGQMNRTLAAVFLRDGQWWLRDRGGAEGILLDGAQVQSGPLPRSAMLRFTDPPLTVRLELEGPDRQRQPGPGGGRSGESAVERTVLHLDAEPVARQPSKGRAAGIRILLGTETHEREFTDTVRIGRDPGCDLRVEDHGVSRMHAEIFRAGEQWFVRDLGSSNGTYLDGGRVQEALLPARCSLKLGAKGPDLVLDHDGPMQPGPATRQVPRSLEEVAAHYFDADSNVPAGDRTMMVRRAFSTVKRRQTRRYRSAIAVVLGLLLVAVGVGIYQYSQLQRTRGLAEQLFYNMKTMELQLAGLETQVRQSGDAALRDRADDARAQLAEMASQYDAFLEELGIAEGELSPEDRLIFRMARVFGECELAMPKGFVTEVKRYIDVWRADLRLANALQHAREQQLVPVITRSMLEQHLPPQFFYVGLQESDLRADAVGPETRFGIAKGLWQLMPATANQYGLRTGPLLELPRFDPADERFDPSAATQAAARYLGDLYRGEAQASGLLVLASYNWGPTRVKKRIRAMNENPRDRNFWALLAQGHIPKETRDYVFLIFAAAVIGEDPGLFGFEFEKPLAAEP